MGNRRKLGAPPERYTSSCSRAAHPFSCWECRTAPLFPCWPCCPVILMVGIPHGSCTSMPAVLPTRIHAGNAARPLYFHAGCVAHPYPCWERRTALLFPCRACCPILVLCHVISYSYSPRCCPANLAFRLLLCPSPSLSSLGLYLRKHHRWILMLLFSID